VRRTLVRFWMAVCLFGMLTLAGTASADTPVLRVLAWPGYAEPEVIKEFERHTNARVELTTIDTDEALWQKVTNPTGPAFDVFAVNTAELQRYLTSNRIQPIDASHLPNTRLQQPRFRDVAQIAGLVHHTSKGEQVYAIPFTYSAMGLIYDKRQVQAAPTSISALWNPRWRGKVIAYNAGTHNFSLAALAMGLPDPFHIPAERTEAVADHLIKLRRNALAFYTQPDESVHLFLRHKAAILFANYGMQQVHLLRNAGVDVGYVIPREGALAWLDCWAIPRNARNPTLAHAWINHLLGNTASRLLVTRQGLASTVSSSAQSGTDGKLIWLQPAEDATRRERLWGRIHAGDSLNKVMRP
jgi:putative spermidine/putrescine transport system substrate-binding protein